MGGGRPAEDFDLFVIPSDRDASNCVWWLLVQSINEGAGEPLVTTATGGKQGGGASLTARCRKLVADFRRVQSELAAAAAAAFSSSYSLPADAEMAAPRKRRSASSE